MRSALDEMRAALDGVVCPLAAAISSDGTRVAVVTRRWDDGAAADIHALQTLHRPTGTWEEVPTGLQPDAPSFSPDGRSLAFTALDADGARQLFAAADGAVTAVTALAGEVRGAAAWSPCGRRLAFSAAATPGPSPGEPLRVTRRFWRWDGIGAIERALAEIWVADLGGGEPRAISADEGIATDPCFSPDGTRVLYRSRCVPGSDDPAAATLKIAELDGTTFDAVDPERRPARGTWVGDGEIAFVGIEPTSPPAVQSHLYVAGLGGSPVRRDPDGDGDLAAMIETDQPSGLPFVAAPLFVDAEGEHMYVRAQIGGRIEVRRVALAGDRDATQVCSGDRVCYPVDLAPAAGVLLVATSSFLAPLELVAVDLESGAEEQLTEFGAAAHTALAGQPPLRQVVATREGAEVEGWFAAAAAAASAASPAPTVLYIHGGPHFALGHVFFADVHLLAAAGFGVLLVNQRGSTGYGEEFATALYGRWGEADVGDLLAVTDAAVAAGLADPERLGVCGASGGGNLTCALVAQTDRFAAAVAENPVTNFVSMYGTSDFGPPFVKQELGGTAPDAFGAWLAHSPLAMTGGWQTPTLLIHGDEDWRCPREQSEQFYRALHEAGCPAEMLLIPGANHTGTVDGTTPMRRLQDDALIDWMLRWLS